MTDTIRVLVVDDHVVVREGLCALITARPDMEVVGEAADGVEAVLKTRSLLPDVILMDLVMPRKSGIEAIREIKDENPEARILVLTSFTQEKRAFLAIEAGALGYLIKDSSSKDLIQAIRRVYRGELSLHPATALDVIRQLRQPSDLPPTEPLAPREIEVLKLVAAGLSNQQIAEELIISERTVAKHVSNILSKLHLDNRTQAALYAIREGLADSSLAQ